MDPEAPPLDSHVQDDKKMEADNDFGDSADPLWSLYGKEAKGHDEATVQTIKDDMDSVLISAGLFSGVLTAFIIDRYQNLQPNSAQQSAYFQQQSTVLLNQISHQLTSLGAQFPSNLSLPGPTFSPSRSDVRVNIYWFASLVSSLSAALLATLVQRWARDHMHIFQRYSHPLRVARIRQYLYEGAERWYMQALAEAVPGLIHISLFLFFIGLTDFLLSTHTIVGKFVILLISLCVTLYILSTVAPLIDPQAPYHTCFSGFTWCLALKLHKRWCKDRFGASGRPLSSNIADGRMQLAMEMNDARKGRDERAIRWLVNNLTEDIKLESFLSGIPGSFNAKWGVEVWKAYPKIRMGENTTSSSTEPTPALPDDNISDSRPPQLLTRRGIGTLLSYVKRFSRTRLHPVPTSHFLRGGEVNELCLLIQSLFETCNRDSFSNQGEWRRRSRACVETAASFVLYIGVDISSFGDIGKILSDLGSAEKTHEVSSASSNLSFISRWTCLSIVLIRKLLDSSRLREDVRGILTTLETFYGADNFDPAETAHDTARRMDREIAAARGLVETLRQKFLSLGEEDRRWVVKEMLSNLKPELEEIQAQAVRMQPMDKSISDLQNRIDQVTQKLIRQLPGVAFDELTEPTPPSHVFDFLASTAYPQLLYLSPRLLGLCFLSDEHIETTEVLKAMKTLMPRRSVVSQCRVMERQLWHLEDLGIGAFGFTLELYFLSLRQILSTFTSQPSESHLSFYIKTFKAITSDRGQFKRSRGTLQIVLNLVLDIAVRDRGIFSNFEYPSYIRWELLELLDAMVKGEASPYIDDAMAELNNVGWRTGNVEFLNHASRIIQGGRMDVS